MNLVQHQSESLWVSLILRKSVRMMIKEAIELGDPNVSHILVPTRYVNQLYGQDSRST